MLVKIKNKQGQSTLEYAFVVAVIVGALIAMQMYIKRSMEGKMKSSSDEIGEQYSAQGSKYTSHTNAWVETDETISPGTSIDSTTGGKTVTEMDQQQELNSVDHVLKFGSETQ